MILNQVMTMLTIVYLIHDEWRFVSQAQRIVEVGSEVLFLAACIVLQQFVDVKHGEQAQRMIELSFFITISALILLNLV